MAVQQKPHPENVPGPFYVVDGCCTSCGVPEMASANFRFLPDGHCYVARQPDDSELEKVLRVVRTQELGCIRYRGSDTAVLRRLAEAGESAQCDWHVTPGITPILRRFVSFTAPPDTAVEALSTVRSGLLLQFHYSIRATDLIGGANTASFTIAWFEDQFHTVEIHRLPEHQGGFSLHHTGPLSLSELIDDVLRVGPYEHVRWSSSASGEQGAFRPC